MIVVPRHPAPPRQALLDALVALAEKARVRPEPADLDARDPEFIDRLRPLLDLWYDRYFSCVTEFVSPLPDEPLLAVANHNGMTGVPDMFCIMAGFWRQYGSRLPAYGLMHDLPFRVPAGGAWLNACGALAANPDNARRALERGAKVLVFPGGDLDACKSYRRRYQIDFAGRTGFLRLAIRAGVRILPVVSVGGHQSLFLLSDGRRIARALRLPKLFRSNVFPIGFALPYGLIFGNPVPHIPLPVKVHTRFLEPLDLGLSPDRADDEQALEEAYRRVVSVMQRGIDQLRREGRHGLFPRA